MEVYCKGESKNNSLYENQICVASFSQTSVLNMQFLGLVRFFFFFNKSLMLIKAGSKIQ